MAKSIEGLPQRSSSSTSGCVAGPGIRYFVSLFRGQSCDRSGHRFGIRKAHTRSLRRLRLGDKNVEADCSFCMGANRRSFSNSSCCAVHLGTQALVGTFARQPRGAEYGSCHCPGKISRSGEKERQFCKRLSRLVAGVPHRICLLCSDRDSRVGLFGGCVYCSGRCHRAVSLPLAAFALVGNLIWGLRQYRARYPQLDRKWP